MTSAARPSENASRGVPHRPAPRRLRERNKQEKLARIERAARQLFTQKGFEGTTTREIAQRARVGAGTLFLYAKDKRELLLRIFRTDSQRAVAASYASIPRRAGLLLHVQHVFDRLLDHYAAAPDLARIFIRELLFAGGDELGALVLEDLDRLAALVRQAQTRGEVRADVAPMMAATNFWAVSYFAFHAWLGGYFSQSTTRSLMHELLEVQMRGLRPQPAGSSRSRRRPARRGGSRSQP